MTASRCRTRVCDRRKDHVTSKEQGRLRQRKVLCDLKEQGTEQQSTCSVALGI
jgi:hypothetical protein